MARVTMNKLAERQQQRIGEITAIGDRMRTRQSDTLNNVIVHARITSVNEVWDNIKATHEVIAMRNDAATHAYMVENRYEVMRSAYEETMDWLLARLVETPDPAAAADNRRNQRRRARDDEDDEYDLNVKLPKLDLPTFSGNYEDWDSFSDQFTALVHDLPRVKDSTKLQYLKSCLTGAAADLVKDVTILGINYASTWKALRDRFHNPRLTINQLLKSLNNLPYLTKESAVDLRSFVDNVQRIVRALTNLKAPVAYWDMWLVHLVEVRVDPESRKTWESELIANDRQIALLAPAGVNDGASRFPKFVDFIAFLERRAQSLSVIHAAKDDKKPNQPNKGKQQNSQRVNHARNAPPAKASKCILCPEQQHGIWQCSKFLGKRVYDRQTDVRQHKLCFNCLGKHKFSDCKTSSRCKSCGGKHHSLLHFDKRPKKETGTSTPDVKPKLPQPQQSTNATHVSLSTDPQFYISDRVDILIGSDLYGQLLRSGLKTFSSTQLVAQNTAFGWIVSGPAQEPRSRRAVSTHHSSITTPRCVVNDDLNTAIERFWTIEEVPAAAGKLKPEDEACEKLFADKHTRDKNGRYRVFLPLKSEPPRVADETRRMAFGSLKHQLQKLSREPKLSNAYHDFMNTYIQLGHMVPVPPSELKNPRSCYLPHHAVITGNQELPKIRVVFDASRRTRDQWCLNDSCMPGPALQADLLLILLEWCWYFHVFTTDIIKMFRQIGVAIEDQDLQRILWPARPGAPPTDYRLTTVTYGTACAPYLAIRTLLQLAKDERARFPLGAQCLEENTYVDDTFAGADDLETALRKRDELIGILKSAGIELDKWAANHSDLLPNKSQSSKNGEIKQIDCDSAVKTLGINWNPSSDQFFFTTKASKNSKGTLTKRIVYSEIASLFDPLGWLAPTTVIAKIIMQDIWIAKCDWDEPLPTELRSQWQNYCQALTDLPSLSIDRWLKTKTGSPVEIHGFSDASRRAYAAAVYIRVDQGNGMFTVKLLAAKTKPAPIKTKSIPNLELCGATLLVQLVQHLRKLKFLTNVPIHLWSDSQIVLMWLKKHPCHWKTFVANRVSLIQTELPTATWSHVPTKQNPADLATRGVLPAELGKTDLWWHGPGWLTSDPTQWPQPPTAVQAMHTKPSLKEPAYLSRYSTLSRLTRVTAWCLRPFLQRIRRKAGQGSYSKTLTVAELDNSRLALIRMAQSHAFSKEIDLLKTNRDLPKLSPLGKLRPFVGSDGILRVGGRLSNTDLPCDVQHPPVLPRDSALSRLYVAHAHYRAFHGGPTLTLSTLLRFVWIVGMRPLVKSFVHKCITCQRHKPRLAHQLMGDLPAARVTPARPFTTTGLDYAGPFQIRTTKGRGHKSYKGYIALFICFATKAIHLEVVSDLTSATFILAFRRFVSRRGMCKQLYSDNATTFRGADAELRTMFRQASEFYQSVASILANDGTTWSWIPPNTPHYGGLWEAGVGSTKHLLKRHIGDHMLTFEEFSTVLVEIEAALNSRPICPLTSDIDDLRALTPAHFLIGAATGVIPDEGSPSVPENRLDRHQLLQRIRDQFWKRWTDEYVLQLQERSKWRNPTTNFAVGQLVLLRDDRYPTAKWPLGRVVEIHPGPDGVVRVVTVKTATNTLRRHIACLAPLHLDQPEEKEDIVALYCKYVNMYEEDLAKKDQNRL